MATLGKPAITTPRSLDLRALQQLVDNIRARLVAAEAAIANAVAAGGDTSAATLAQLQTTVAALVQRLVSVEAAVGLADVIELPAAESVALADPVVPLVGTTCGVLDPNDTTRMFGFLGLAMNAAAAGQTVRVRRRGPMSIDGAAFDVGREVYARAGGGLTQLPTYVSVAVPIGVAISATEVWVGQGFPALVDPGFYGDPYNDALPVTWGLLRQFLP